MHTRSNNTSKKLPYNSNGTGTCFRRGETRINFRSEDLCVTADFSNVSQTCLITPPSSAKDNAGLMAYRISEGPDYREFTALSNSSD